MQSRSLVFFLLWISLIWISISSARIDAQTISFAPAKILVSTYEFSLSKFDRIYRADLETESVLARRRKQVGLSKESVEGRIELTQNKHLFKIQYGLNSMFNLGMSIPCLDRHRISDLTANQDDGVDFVEEYASEDASGVGDVAIFGLWRIIYRDNIDFQSGLEFKADNGSYYVNRPEKLSLGNGMQEITAFLNAIFYSNTSTLTTTIKIAGTTSLSKKVKDSDKKEKTMSRGFGAAGDLDLSYYISRFYFGGGLQTKKQAGTNIGAEDRQDGSTSFSYHLFFSLGNMNLLEEKPINYPWELQFQIQKVFWGLSADEINELMISASFYF